MNKLNLILSVYLFANVTALSDEFVEIQDRVSVGTYSGTDERSDEVVIVSSDNINTEKTIIPDDNINTENTNSDKDESS